MNDRIDVRLENLSAPSAGKDAVLSERLKRRQAYAQKRGVEPPASEIASVETIAPLSTRTFYLETFGCQMNDHDSEKVAGLLLSRGYRQVEKPEAAGVVLYNTCSIREKAAS